MAIPEITVDDLAERLAAGARLVDVREPDEYDEAPRRRAPCWCRWRPCPTTSTRSGATARRTSSASPAAAACERASSSPTTGIDAVNVAGGTLAWISRVASTCPAPREHRSRSSTASLDRPARTISTTSSTRWSPSRATRSTPSSIASAPTSRRWRSCSSRWDDELVLIDPLAVDVDGAAAAVRVRRAGRVPRRPAGPRRAHPRRRCGARASSSTPRSAAGFLGYGTPSLVVAPARRARRQPAEGRPPHRLAAPPADRRPSASTPPATSPTCWSCATRCSPSWPSWVASSGSSKRARSCASGRPAAPTPTRRGLRLKDVRGLRPRPRAVAQSVAAWRERTAMRRNIPVRQVLPDLAVLGIAQRQPSTEKELAQARGVDERFSRGKPAAEILAAVAEGKLAEPPTPGPAATTSTATCARPSRWCRRGSARSPATSGSTPRSWPRDPTWSRSSPTIPTPAWPSGGGRAARRRASTRLVDGRAALTFDRGDGLRLVDVG